MFAEQILSQNLNNFPFKPTDPVQKLTIPSGQSDASGQQFRFWEFPDLCGGKPKILLLVLQEMGEVLDHDGVQLSFKAIRADMGLSISIESPYDRVRAAANVKQAYETSAQLGTLPKNFQPQNVYNIYANYLRAVTGEEDVSEIIIPPEDMPQPSKLEQIITKFITVSKIRSEIAATQLAEAKVNDMKADVAKKLNDALYDLAKIEEIKANTKISMLETMLKAKQLEQDAANDVTQNAQEQERIDNDHANQANQTTTAEA